MSVNTAKVPGRRDLHFNSLVAMLAEAQRLADAPRVTMLGNWTLGQVLGHLATTMHMSLDGSKVKAAWYLRLVGPWLKKGLLSGPMPAGFRLPAKLARQMVPGEDVRVQEAMASFREAVERLKREEHRAPHVVFGRMTRAEWDRLHLRHAEMHLSFAVPEGEHSPG